jgi:hypothetical protein
MRPQPRVHQKVYRLSGGIVAVPHVSMRNVYVLPGYRLVTESALLKMGGYVDIALLFPRELETDHEV